jgi:ribA/ribD-fused uncharacterized protein
MAIMQFHSKSKKTEPPFAPTAMKDLSNFSDHDVLYGGHTYKTVEHAFQALKYSCTDKPELVNTVRLKFADKTGVEAKSSGGKGAMKVWKVTLDVPCWENTKVGIMRDLIASKMERHPEIREIINVAKENNIILVHFSRSDMYWGAHVNESGTGIKNGQNMLGKLFMSYYDSLSQSSTSSSSGSSSSSTSGSSSPSTSSSSSPLIQVKQPTPPPVAIASPHNQTRKASPKLKECTPDQIRNPITNRCVSRTSKLGKSILQNQRTPSPQTRKASPQRKQQTPSSQTRKASPQRKECTPDQIRNPDTNRCVSRTTKLGKSILAKMA